MPKDRKITRENRKREQALDRRNAYGNTNQTPYEAVKRIIKEEQQLATQSA